MSKLKAMSKEEEMNFDLLQELVDRFTKESEKEKEGNTDD